MKDLAIIVADSNMEQAVKAALLRPQSLGIRPITFNVDTHPQRDSGMRVTGPQMLALQRRQYNYGLIMLDFVGSGSHHPNSIALEKELDERVNSCWESRAKAIVIDPELDIWMWGSDNALKQIFGWSSEKPLRDWLEMKGMQFLPDHKPEQPKEAIEKIMFELKRPRSSALYYEIASRISLGRCTDNAFLRLSGTLQTWFPK
ncbi:hypothetical protein JXJ21_22815 [candidate division KSB1 bacterium]|nr:hypothetical protein [candidate division KSB1 bacterium]